MSIRNSTKLAFANALKSLLNTRDLSAVRVQELCRICGTERPTFYYHFRDKYDLISWIYEQDFQESVRLAGGRYDASQLENLLLLMKREQVFYRKAFDDSAQNALLSYVLQSNIQRAHAYLKAEYAMDELSAEVEFRIHLHTYAWCGGLREWINGKYEFTAAQFARIMYNSLIDPARQPQSLGERD